MEKEILRDPDVIAKQMLAVRRHAANMHTWTLQEVLSDIESLTLAINKDAVKASVNLHGSNVAKKRIRRYLVALETLGKKFRSISV